MLLKIIGLTVVMTASTLIGFKMAYHLEGRLNDLRNLQLSLQVLEREMVFLSNPLPRALLSASNVKSRLSKIFKECGELLKSKQGYCINEAWEIAVNNNFYHTFLDNHDKQILLSLGKCLGVYDINNQTNNIKMISSQISVQEKKAEEYIAKNSRVYKNLGVLSGAAIAIVLL